MSKQPRGNVRVGAAHTAGARVSNIFVDAENQGQTGESVPDPGLMDEIIPDMNREDPIGDSQEMMSHSAGRTDSGSKIGCSTESVESGEKISQNCNLLPANSSHPSRSCNANIYSGCENTKRS